MKEKTDVMFLCRSMTKVLFIYGLLNGVVSGPNYTVSNDMSAELEKRKGVVMV